MGRTRRRARRARVSEAAARDGASAARLARQGKTDSLE
ncbi:hypothetical protein BMAPRL20_A1500 [Burkholderia mallei PRL-20]|nr:hypothetical protein BMASAVP1_A1959 [Burkholderia mallei SAVP1]ABN02961.1 hypothetical protein BMA10229_A3346 [Burkholderia mallei NCTC 10229]ABN90417.1 hypothetical protein BURPS1106A_2367 [Burkholderia pseudomallei 1106a]ABO06301.1 hypothetical protein BMA10247_1234 [Burkholderia mallei NCTC 10247]AFR16280.1 hypothetical protein BPC006_I2412 [Burkholderia pseudomallei BPC006]EDK56735.1 hypothetical protein BMAFMH_C1014 [Burkholderia mallei FMH]EDK60908.1 hypothetical protein BMAJHU_C1072